MRRILRESSFPLLALCALLGACGGTPSPSQPGSEPPPTPAPTPTSAGFLHVLQQPYLMTYGIDAPTGRLHPPLTQRIGEAAMLASDPRGRRVYAAHGHSWFCRPEPALAIVAYVPDPRDGTLTPISEVPVSGGRWTKFYAGSERVHGLVFKMYGSCSGFDFTYTSVEVASDGRLGEVRSRPFPWDEESGRVNVDVRSDTLYKAGRPHPNGLGGLAALAIQPDGDLRHTGWTDLCVATTMEPFNEYDPHPPSPLAAARGFLFAAVSVTPERRTVCSYLGPRLKPIADLGFTAYVAEAFVPGSESQPAWLAMGVEVPAGKATRHELRLFSMNADGNLGLLDAKELPDVARQLLFHPSGRLLYVTSGPFFYISDTADSLLAYAIGPEGRLELTESIDYAGGGLAISVPSAGS